MAGKQPLPICSSLIRELLLPDEIEPTCFVS